MPNLDRREYTKKELSQELRNIFSYYESYRQQYEKKAIEWYKTFVGYVDDKDVPENKSNLHIPKSYEILDTIRSRIIMSFFDTRPYIEFRPMPAEGGSIESMVMNEDKAEIAASFVDEQLEKNNIKSVFYDFVTSMLIFPAGIMGVGWRFEEDYIKRKAQVPEIDPYTNSYTGRYIWDIIESLETVFDDNEVFNVDFFDFWPDPDATNLDDARGVFHREWITVEELVDKIELLQRVGDGRIYEVDIDKLATSSKKHDEGRHKRLTAVGISSGGRDPYASVGDEGLEAKQEVELLHYWEDDRHTIMINRQECIYDGPSPYWRHRKKPFVMASYDQLPNEIYGLSAVQILHPMQEELNTMHNQRMDNVSMLVNRMWKRMRGADISDEQLVSRPNAIIDVDNMEDLLPIDMPDIPQSAFASEQNLSTNIERALGTPANVRGAESGKSQTATEAQITSESAISRFQSKIQLFEDVGLKRLAEMMDLNNQQFITNERAARQDPEDVNSWRAIHPDDLIGEFDYSPASKSIDAAANKELRREQLTEIIGFLMQAEVPFINYQSLITEWLSEFDIDNPEKFLIPEEEYSMIQRRVIEELSAQAEVPADQEGFGAEAGQQSGGGGALGRGQIQRPERHGGLTATGRPQPQPGQRGGG